MVRRALVVFELLLAVAIGGAGCKQADGERCEQDSDCKSGMCSVNTPSIGGVCRGPNDTTPPPDAGGNEDALPDGSEGEGGADADQEAGTSSDAAEAGTPTDAAESDAVEAGAPTDAADDGAPADAAQDS